MKHFWLLLTIALFFLNCTTNSKTSDISQFIPNDANIVVKANNIKGLNSNLKNNDFLKKISSLVNYERLEKKLRSLSLLNTETEIIFSLSKNAQDSLDFTFATIYTDSIIDFKDETNYISESLTIESQSFEKISYNDQIFYTTVLDSFLVASSNLEKIKNFTLSKKVNDTKHNLLKSTNPESSFSLYIDENAFSKESTFLLDSVPMSNFTNYFLIDAIVSQDNIQLNGITKATDSTKSLINVFKNNRPQENKTAVITPTGADGFISFTFENYNKLFNNLNKFRTTNQMSVADSTLIEEPLFGNIEEVGVIFEGNQHALVLNSLDEIITKDALLSYQNVEEIYRDIDLLSFEKPELFKTAFYPLVTFDDLGIYCIIDNFFVFANNKELLQNIIASYQSNSTYSTNNSFIEIKKQLSDAASLLMVFDDNKFSKILDTATSIDLKNYKTSAIQFIYDQDFAHINLVVNKTKVRANANTVSEIFNIKLDADLLNVPQFVTNHTNKQKDIAVQDVNNNLYLISNKGEVFWKKKLEGPVLGRIEQVDIFKNGRLQLAFATPNRVYVLDRNGKDVSPFPLKFNDPITQALSVFDYDNKRDYRLLVTQGKDLLMYDLKGKTVKGFGFKTAPSDIVTQPQHFRIGSKDYIVIKSKENLHILSRRGSDRIIPKSSISFSTEPVYVYLGNFITTSQEGQLIMIEQNGNTSSQTLNLGEQHHIDATSKTLATFTDNKLTIKSHKIELDYGIYSKPKIFYINDKIYLSITDKQTNKVYLFDSLGKSISNFPVYGSSEIDMNNADSDRNPEIVVKSGTDELILYQVN